MATADSTGGAPDAPPSRTAYVLERLREDIAHGVITPGAPLRQADLARRYGVSPTPVREALRLLEADGSISYSPHRGATVTELSTNSIVDLYLVRSAVESLGTRLAVERMEDGEVARLRTIHERLTEATEAFEQAVPEQLARMNRELHFVLYDASSSLIVAQVSSLWRMFPPKVTMWRDAALARTFVEEHEQLVQAVEARDAESAEQAMAAHIATACRFRTERDHDG